MGKYRDIRAAIVSLLQTVELQGVPAFVEVTTEPKIEFAGYPAVSVLPNAVTSDYLTVAENQRGYGFVLVLHIDREQDAGTAIDNAIDLVDAVMDKLDQTIDLHGACDFLRAVPLIGFNEQDDALVLVPTIEVVAIQSIDVRL